MGAGGGAGGYIPAWGPITGEPRREGRSYPPRARDVSTDNARSTIACTPLKGQYDSANTYVLTAAQKRNIACDINPPPKKDPPPQGASHLLLSVQFKQPYNDTLVTLS
eukprot:1191197-Prorocentrum_minimum.AAC.1